MSTDNDRMSPIGPLATTADGAEMSAFHCESDKAFE